VTTRRDEGLRSEIGPLGLSANIGNTMIGAGIFLLPALVAQRLEAVTIRSRTRGFPPRRSARPTRSPKRRPCGPAAWTPLSLVGAPVAR